MTRWPSVKAHPCKGWIAGSIPARVSTRKVFTASDADKVPDWDIITKPRDGVPRYQSGLNNMSPVFFGS